MMQGQNELTQNTYQFTRADRQFINQTFEKLRNEGIKISEVELSDLLNPFFKQGFRTKGTLEILNPLLDYLPHKFKMTEALVLNRYIRGLLHPTNQEIDEIMKRLRENQEEFPLIKLTFQSNNQAIDCDTIIVIGSHNVGKDMFICNLINYLYQVDYFGLFRISIINTEQMNECIEYVVEYDGETFYKIISCPAIGNMIQDQKIIIRILEKISMIPNKIKGIFLINSACKTRLGIEEKYIIQRFFELFPKYYLDNIFLILTSSTDNFANTEIYTSIESPTPQNFKKRIPKTSEDEDENKTIDILRCFALNNNCIYQMSSSYERIYPLVTNIIEGIRSESPNQDDQTNQTDTESIISSKKNEVDDMFCQYWNKDCKTMDKLYQELQKIKPPPLQLDNQYFKQLKILEEKLNIFLDLFKAKDEKVEEFKYQISQSRFYLSTSVISITQPKGEVVMQGTQALFCSKCHIICHKACQLTTTENYESLKQSKSCHKFNGNFREGEKKPTECQNCQKFNRVSKCQIGEHQLLSTISVIDLYQDSRPNENQFTARQFMDQYLINKLNKRKHQQKRLEYYENQKEKERQTEIIVENLINLKNQGLLDINLKTRLDYIDESIKIKSNDNEEKVEYISCQKMYQYLIDNENLLEIQQMPLNTIAILEDYINNQEIQSNNGFSIPEDISPQRENLRNSAIYNGQALLIPSYNSHKK